MLGVFATKNGTFAIIALHLKSSIMQGPDIHKERKDTLTTLKIQQNHTDQNFLLRAWPR